MHHSSSRVIRAVCLLVAIGAALVAAPPQSIPLVFEPNLGQWEQSIQYVGRAGDTTVLLTGREAIFILARVATRTMTPSTAVPQPAPERAAVRMKLGNSAKFVPSGRQPGVSHYFIGKNPAAWRRNVPQFARV